MSENGNPKRHASRKFLVVLIGQAMAFICLFAGKISGSEFVTITLGLSGGYLTANVTAGWKGQ